MRWRRRRPQTPDSGSDEGLSGEGVTEASPEGAPSPDEADGTDGDGGESGESGEAAPTKGLIASTREALRPISKRHVITASLGLMAVGFAGVLLFSAFGMWWTSQPSFCNKCHVMNKYVAAWESSKHTGVTCENCHINPGLFTFVGGKISGLQVVANYITGHYEDYSFNASVSNAACFRCHEDIMEAVTVDKTVGIRVSHFEIIENGGKCMSCHSTVAHGAAVPIGSATFPTMDKCLTCHDDTTAPVTDCALCHLTPPIGNPPEGGT